jgi:tetratricopeptide (TPR) repeat protein
MLNSSLIMNFIYRIILILSLAGAIIFLPQPALAEQSSVNADELFKRGVYQALMGNYRLAIADFTQVIQLRPDDATAYANEGLARAAMGDSKGAIADFNSALRLDPNLEVAHYNRGYVRFELQDYQGALLDLNRAIAINPENADAYHCRCLVRHQLGDMRGVAEDLHTTADLYLKAGKLDEYKGLLNVIKDIYSPKNAAI